MEGVESYIFGDEDFGRGWYVRYTQTIEFARRCKEERETQGDDSPLGKMGISPNPPSE